MQIKLLSWNIWCDGNINEVNKFIENSKADIICLQEVIPSDLTNPMSFLTDLEFNSIYADSMEIKHNGKLALMGNATSTKLEIVNHKIHLLSDNKKRIALQTDIKINNQILHVFNTHLTHAHLDESEERNLQMETLLKIIPNENTIILGDYNSLPQSETIAKINNVLVNTDPLLTPTWSNYTKGCTECKVGEIKYRLDYIFASKNIYIISSMVEKSLASDHLPISTIIEV